MHHTVALVCHHTAYLLDSGRVGAFQRDGMGDFADDLLQARPFTIDVEWVESFVERIGWNGDDVQTAIQRRRGNALIRRQPAHEWVLRNEEAVGAVSVFPRNSVDGFVGGDQHLGSALPGEGNFHAQCFLPPYHQHIAFWTRRLYAALFNPYR